MAKVKIFLGPGETIQDAEDSILKAMIHHNSGEVHSSHSFQDPAMVAVAAVMEKTHVEIYKDMLNEIFEALDQDFTNGNK